MQNITLPYPGPERRKYKRISFWALARYKKLLNDDEFRHAQIQNISAGGALLKSKNEIDINTALEIELYIPYVRGYHLLKAKAKTVWIKPTGAKDYWYAGVEFEHIDDESKIKLEEFIRYFDDKALSHYRDIRPESYLHIPYWCIVQEDEIAVETPPENHQTENSYNVIFESKKKYILNSLLELELKIPTIKMPFKVKGMVLDVQEIKKDSLSSIYLQLKSLTQNHLELMKKFAQE